jgi:putative ABC transport system permease protein
LSEAEAEACAVQSYDWRLLECELSRAEQPLAMRTLQPSLGLIERKGGMQMESLLQDLRFGARMLVKNPGFSLIAVLTLALGIGANTALFSIVNTVLLRPLPFRQPDRLAYVWTTVPSSDAFGASYADFRDWREQSQMFEGMAAASIAVHNLTGGDESEQVQRWRASANMFQVLGVNPILGRSFLPEEEQWGRHRVLILGYGLWKRRFGADAQILGRQIQLDGAPFTVVGVMPSNLRLPGPPVDVWIPLAFPPGDSTPTPSNRGFRFLRVVGRLKPGVTVEQADQQIKAVARGIAEKDLGNRQVGARVVGMADWNTRLVRKALLVLMGAVGFVLFIACINVANLLLARATEREKEIAIRTTMGASRGRLLRQLLTESGLLALLGGGAGLSLAYWGLKAVITFGPTEDVPRLDQIRLDSQALGFTLGVSLLTSLVFGLVPALRASKPNLQEAIKESSRGSSVGRRSRRLFQGLVVTEIALALTLLVGAGLLVKSFSRLQAVNLGFDPNDVLAMRLRLNPTKYQGQEARFYRQLLDRVEKLPEVKSAGAAFPQAFPLRAGDSVWGLEIEGRPSAVDAADGNVGWRQVTPNFFRVLGIPLIRGRLFTEQDRPESPLVGIINQTMARRFFADEDPIGKRIRLGGASEPMMTIIGVVGDTRLGGMDMPSEGLVVYASHEQGWRGASGEMWLLARAMADPLRLAGAVKEQVKLMDKEAPIAEVTTMEGILGSSVADKRFNMFLLGVLALMALLLAVVGIYGVMAHSVNQRAHEIGIRLALGAQTGDVLRLVLRQSLTLTLIGVSVGLAGAWGLTRVMSNLLFEVSATDLVTFIGVALMLAVAAILACYFPARRATKVDPLVALRSE